MAVFFFRTEYSARQLRQLAKQEKGRVMQRFLMIANMLDGMDHDTAAHAAGLGRTSAYKWHNIYEEEGIDGLRHSGYSGRDRRVSDEIAQKIKERVVAGASLEQDNIIAFRAYDVRKILKNDYDIDLSLSSVYRLLHHLKLSWLVPRPQHPGSDAQAQQQFRKLFTYN